MPETALPPRVLPTLPPTPTQPQPTVAWPVRLGAALLWLGLTAALALLYGQPAWSDAQVEASRGQVLQPALVAAALRVGPGSELTLPHGANGSAPSTGQRYRLVFELAPDQAAVPQGMCLERSTLVADAWLDGQRLAVDPSASKISLRRMWPQYLRLPPPLAPGRHLLELHLAAPLALRDVLGATQSAAALLAAPPAPLAAAWLGDDPLVRQGCETAAALTAELPTILLGTLAAAGTLALMMAGLLRDAAARWFALATLSWAASLLVYSTGLLPWVRAEPELLFLLLPVLRMLVFWVLVLFYLRQAELQLPRLERALLGWMGIAAALQLLLPDGLRWMGQLAVAGFIFVVGAGLLVLMARQAQRRAALSVDALFLALLMMFVATLVEIARMFGWARGLPPLLPILAVPTLTGGIGLRMIERLAMFYTQQGSAAAWLQAELQRHQGLLGQSFEALRRQRDAEVEAAARQRITRELHDGLGSHLVAAAALLASTRPAPGDRLALVGLVDQALQELRSALDAITGDAGDLAELLGALRDRLEPVLVARGIELDWQVAALPGTVGLGVAERLDVLRIVQEAFANIVKHAGPCQATLLARPTTAGGSLIVIADNGAGLQAGRRDGVGLPSMRERALRLNAGLEIGPAAPAAPGCRVALSLPPPAAAAAWDGGERRLALRRPLPARRD